MATVYDIIKGISQAAANAYDGAQYENLSTRGPRMFTKDGKAHTYDLKREMGYPITDSRVMDGFGVRFYGTQLIITYQSEIPIKEFHDSKSDQSVEQTYADIVKFLKKEYKTIIGDTLSLKENGPAEIRLQHISRVRSWVQATKVYAIGGSSFENWRMFQLTRGFAIVCYKHQMGKEDWNNIRNVLRKPEKATEIHKLLVDMFPNQKEMLEYLYNNERDTYSYNNFERCIHGIDKYILEGPSLIDSSNYQLTEKDRRLREKKYQQYTEDKKENKKALFFNCDTRDPREVNFSELPPVLIGEEGLLIDGRHRTFLAHKAKTKIKAYKIVAQKNNHPNVKRILQIVKNERIKELANK